MCCNWISLLCVLSVKPQGSCCHAWLSCGNLCAHIVLGQSVVQSRHVHLGSWSLQVHDICLSGMDLHMPVCWQSYAFMVGIMTAWKHMCGSAC